VDRDGLDTPLHATPCYPPPFALLPDSLAFERLKKPRHADFLGILKGSAAPIAPLVHPLVTLLASLSRQELAWDYMKIVQAVRRLGHKVSRQSVKNILVEAGFGPEPHDHPDTWSNLLRRLAATMWQGERWSHAASRATLLMQGRMMALDIRCNCLSRIMWLRSGEPCFRG